MHAHPHQHPHEEGPHEQGPHEHRRESANAAAGNGPVLIDVGDGAGALVLHADEDLVGREIEISPQGEDGRRSHVAVLARPLGGRTVCAAVYPTLNAGSWQLWAPGATSPTLTVRIDDGRVTQARWPGPTTA